MISADSVENIPKYSVCQTHWWHFHLGVDLPEMKEDIEVYTFRFLDKTTLVEMTCIAFRIDFLL